MQIMQLLGWIWRDFEPAQYSAHFVFQKRSEEQERIGSKKAAVVLLSHHLRHLCVYLARMMVAAVLSMAKPNASGQAKSGAVTAPLKVISWTYVS